MARTINTFEQVDIFITNRNINSNYNHNISNLNDGIKDLFEDIVDQNSDLRDLLPLSSTIIREICMINRQLKHKYDNDLQDLKKELQKNENIIVSQKQKRFELSKTLTEANNKISKVQLIPFKEFNDTQNMNGLVNKYKEMYDIIEQKQQSEKQLNEIELQINKSNKTNQSLSQEIKINQLTKRSINLDNEKLEIIGGNPEPYEAFLLVNIHPPYLKSGGFGIVYKALAVNDKILGDNNNILIVKAPKHGCQILLIEIENIVKEFNFHSEIESKGIKGTSQLFCKKLLYKIQNGRICPLLALKYISDAFTIAEILDANIILSSNNVTKIMIGAFTTMNELYEKCGIVHSDLNPNNIMINLHSLQPTIIDFGGAEKMKEKEEKQVSREIGTCTHAAPESCVGTISKKSDIWSFGCIAINLYYREQLISDIGKLTKDNFESIRNDFINKYDNDLYIGLIGSMIQWHSLDRIGSYEKLITGFQSLLHK